MYFKEKDIKTIVDLKTYFITKLRDNNVKVYQELISKKISDRGYINREFKRVYRNTLNRAIQLGKKNGIIIKEPCLKCGRKTKIQAHHPNKKEPFQIVWLCEKCHTTIHNYAYTRDWINKQKIKII